MQYGWLSQRSAGGRPSFQINATTDPLVPLGLDFLTFLAATVLVIPLFKSVKASPVLGFLFSGLLLGQLGLFRNIEDIQKLSELGVLFLLFEMGLELSLDRLKALAKFAFGLGTLQMLLCTLAFTLFALPVGNGIGTQILVKIFHAPGGLAAIRTVDEAVVIGAALSLSSSAFVLQLLSENGELSSKFGSATLGILLLQDIAVVPFLVLLPFVETNDLGGQSTMSLVYQLGPTALKTLGSLAALLVVGRLVMRRLFELVAESRSDETFISLCLLTVTGAGLLTQKLGLSDTLGAFSAGVLLAETNYRTQVEADIRPFRGILLGLFFVTTGSSLDLALLFQQWPIVLALTGGLISVKVGIIGSVAPLFGLTRGESVRTAFMLAQGGEFAFVLLSLAAELKVLPEELNKLLIIVVVISMALTPGLASIGKKLADKYDEEDEQSGAEAGPATIGAGSRDMRPVVICGFGELGQSVVNMLESPLSQTLERGQVPYVAFDLQPARIKAARAAGFNVVYGDASRASVLEAAGIEKPRALAVVYTARARLVTTVHSLREHYPSVPIYVRALDLRHAAELKAAGADYVTAATTEAGIALGSRMLQELGGRDNDIAGLTRALRKQLDDRSHDMMRVLTNELPAPSANLSGEEDVFVFDQAAVSKNDLPSLSALATPGVNTAPRGQENAASMGLQEAPSERPVPVAEAAGSIGKDNGTSESDNVKGDGSNGRVSESTLSDDEQRNKHRDGADSCPTDGGKQRSYVGSKSAADDE